MRSPEPEQSEWFGAEQDAAEKGLKKKKWGAEIGGGLGFGLGLGLGTQKWHGGVVETPDPNITSSHKNTMIDSPLEDRASLSCKL